MGRRRLPGRGRKGRTVTALRRLLRHRATVLLCQIAIGLVFLAAALPKIGDSFAFARQIHNYRLVPAELVNLLAITLPWIELVTALAILLRFRARAGAIVAAGLMVLFLGAVGSAVARGLDIECGCFGTSDAAKVGFAKLAENVGLLLLALGGSLRPR